MNRNKSRSSIEPVNESDERFDKSLSLQSSLNSNSSSCQLENSANFLSNGLTMNVVGPPEGPSSIDAMFNRSTDEGHVPQSGHKGVPPGRRVGLPSQFENCAIGVKRNHSDVELSMSRIAACFQPDRKVHQWLEAARRNSDPTAGQAMPFLRGTGSGSGEALTLHSGHNSKSEGTDSVGSSYHSDSGELIGSMPIGDVLSSDLQTAKEILGHDSFACSTASSSPKESSKSANNGLSSDASSRSLPPGGEVDKISFSSIGKSSKNSSSDKKRKSSNWYNVLSPTYKSRCEDFKKVFKGISHEERLIVDYSCALHKDILIQGRLYVTQNWICFYANIFRWETVLTIRCKDISAMTKEKTARVIPNAIQICTQEEKYNFSSLNHRDKSYLMMFRVWQNALCDQQMTPQEMWQWVHHSYGEELGLHSSDEDYTQPTLEDEANFQAVLLQDEETLISTQNGLESLPTMQVTKYTKEDDRVDFIDAPISPLALDPDDDEGNNSSLLRLLPIVMPSTNGTLEEDGPSFLVPQLPSRSPIPDANGNTSSLKIPTDLNNGADLPTDLGDTTEDDEVAVGEVECSGHDHLDIVGVDAVYGVSVDKMFEWLFTDSQFYRDFQDARKTFDLSLGEWPEELDENGEKRRFLNYVLSLNYSVGPKSSPLAETQIARQWKPGRFYLVDTEASNSGIPYADSFYVINRYCISRVGLHKCRLLITCEIKYRKSVWGLVKNFIEKNATSGINESYNLMGEMLHQEVHKQNQMQTTTSSASTPGRKKVLRRRKNSDRAPSGKRPAPDIPVTKPNSLPQHIPHRSVSLHPADSWHLKVTGDTLVRLICLVLLVLVLFNGVLFYKLWTLEGRANGQYMHRPMFSHGKPGSREEWAEVLDQQRSLYQQEMERWKEVLAASIQLMDHMKSSLADLQVTVDQHQSMVTPPDPSGDT